MFNQDRSTFSNKFEDISLNIQLSPIHSKRTEDNSILPLTDSLLMQCLARTDTGDELCKLLGMGETGPNDAAVATFRDSNEPPYSNQNYVSKAPISPYQ